MIIAVTGERLALRAARHTCAGELRWTLRGVRRHLIAHPPGSSDWLRPAASGPFWAVGIFQVLCTIVSSSSGSTTTAKTYWALVIQQVLFWYVLSLFFSQLPWEAGSIIIPVSYKCRKWDKRSFKKEASQGPAAERTELGFKLTVWSQSLYTCYCDIRTCLLHSICVSGFSHDIWGLSPSPLLRNPTKTRWPSMAGISYLLVSVYVSAASTQEKTAVSCFTKKTKT